MAAYPEGPSELSCLTERSTVLLRDVRVVVIAILAETLGTQLNDISNTLVAERIRLPASQEVSDLFSVRHQLLSPRMAYAETTSRHREWLVLGS